MNGSLMRRALLLISFTALIALLAFYLIWLNPSENSINFSQELQPEINARYSITPVAKKSRSIRSNESKNPSLEDAPITNSGSELISKPFRYDMEQPSSEPPTPAPAPAPTAPRSSNILNVRTPQTLPANTSSMQSLISDLSKEGSQRLNSDNSYIGGVRVGSGSTAPLPTPAVATETPTPTPEPTLERVGGQARGYLMLYLMHPAARQTVEKQVENLLKAEINELFLGVLTDGTFSQDFDYLSSVVRRLNTAGRSLTLVLYVTNGPSMRNYENLPIEAGFNAVNPLLFRELIRFDLAIRNRFINLLSQTKPIFELNSTLNVLNRNIAVVMLEDNLDVVTYGAMREMASAVLGNGVGLFRNPCPGCFEGNDTDTLGDGLELHAPADMAELLFAPQGGYTLDGFGYRFSEEINPLSMDLETLFELELQSLNRGALYFGLWRAERQGIYGSLVHPNERQYEVPSEEQLALEIELLRHGLSPN